MFDPRCPYDLSLDCFSSSPEAERPAFTFRRLNGAEYIQLEKVFDIAGRRASECADELYSALCVGLMGWKRQASPSTGNEVPYTAETAAADIREIIDPQDAFELIMKRLNRASLNGAERKNSESQS